MKSELKKTTHNSHENRSSKEKWIYNRHYSFGLCDNQFA